MPHGSLKANRVLASIKRAFTDLNNDGFLKLFKAMVRPIIELCKYNLGSTLFVETAMERVQRRTTKMIPSLSARLSDKSYHHHLILLDLPSLNHRRITERGFNFSLQVNS